MRLLTVEFENINSYKGHWVVDFTDEEYEKNDFQFVISGPTASGKTTILDAITLALYGRTPRQDRMNGENNEVMNKESGSCMASVTYTCEEGVIRSVFSQQRAHNKVGGKLQNPRVRIENAGTGEVLKIGEETCEGRSVEKLAKGTKELIGLTYDQFVRSIMIPQGEFSRFLRSSSREKAAILARVSGTGHYKQIGAEVWAEADRFTNVYDDIRRQRDAVEVMSQEETDSLRAAMDADEREVGEERRKSGELQRQIAIKEQWNDAVKELEKAEADFRKAQEESRAFEGGRKILERAQKAVNCRASHMVLKGLRESLKSEEQEKERAENAAVAFGKLCTEKSEQETKCRQAFSELESKETANYALWKSVRQLDARLGPAKTVFEEKRKASAAAMELFAEKERTAAGLAREIASLQDRITEREAYLRENQKDGELTGICAMLETQRKNLSGAVEECAGARQNRERLEREKQQEEEKRDAYRRERERCSAELLGIVEQKHVVIAGILRSRLKDGKACPVCGSEYHATCVAAKDFPKEDAEEGETTRVAANVADLSSKLEEAKDREAASERAIERLAGGISAEDEKRERALNRQRETLDAINDRIRPWNVQVELSGEEAVGNLRQVIDDLSKRAEIYETTRGELSDSRALLEGKKASRGEIDLDKLKAGSDAAAGECAEAERAYEELLKGRTELFGDRDVDREENEFRSRLKTWQEAWDRAKSERQDADGKKREQENRKETAVRRIGELQGQIGEEEKRFDDVLRKNGFASTAEFVESEKTDEEISVLSERKTTLENKVQVAETTLRLKRGAKEALDGKESAGKTAEELGQELRECKLREQEAMQRYYANRSRLENDNAQRERRSSMDEELNRLAEKKEICDNLKSLIGVQKGDDFEVFVQNIAMKNLVRKANEYMAMLEPDQQLILRDDESMEIFVQEGEIVRPITNTSGGETFCISLSLALAMAEFAGKNGSIEALFLDEGFGTLSGEPLRNAITSLKRLGATGKLLGIITHVEDVIKEFDLKLTATKQRKTSRLSGPGVSREAQDSGAARG